MLAICLLVHLGLLVFATSGEETDTVNPGFYLKVAKNVPRLGRRSDALVPDPAHNDERVPNWFERVVTASKREQIGGKGPYNKVIPFDPNLMFDLATSSSTGNAHHGGVANSDDLKFVSWRDFDIALESDTDLFEKLTQLAKSEADLDMQAIEFQEFVPLPYNKMGGGTSSYNDHMYYRLNRSPKGGRPTEINKERVEYQM